MHEAPSRRCRPTREPRPRRSELPVGAAGTDRASHRASPSIGHRRCDLAGLDEVDPGTVRMLVGLDEAEENLGRGQ